VAPPPAGPAAAPGAPTPEPLSPGARAIAASVGALGGEAEGDGAAAAEEEEEGEEAPLAPAAAAAAFSDAYVSPAFKFDAAAHEALLAEAAAVQARVAPLLKGAAPPLERGPVAEEGAV